MDVAVIGNLGENLNLIAIPITVTLAVLGFACALLVLIYLRRIKKRLLETDGASTVNREQRPMNGRPNAGSIKARVLESLKIGSLTMDTGCNKLSLTQKQFRGAIDSLRNDGWDIILIGHSEWRLESQVDPRETRMAAQSDIVPQGAPVRTQSSTPSIVPEIFEGYALQERLMSGGMAEAYKAKDIASGETVFLKRVRRDAREVKALQREFAIYQKLMRLGLPQEWWARRTD